MKIGKHIISSPLILAPMAGVTDGIVRAICLKHGAGMTVSEMVPSDAFLYNSSKTKWRLKSIVTEKPKSVQIVGNDAKMMSEAAKLNVDLGADIIDINMGCPAKKVCNKLAGSALMQNEVLVQEILEKVVASVNVPVTLKIRTGWDTENKNALSIAKMAENSGIQAVAIHGRTRACRFKGEVEYDTIAKVKSELSIPVIANGDINSIAKAKYVLTYTNADAIMLGRAAQGNPWLFEEVLSALNEKPYTPPSIQEKAQTMFFHLEHIYQLYGEYSGVRIARKHISWYSQGLDKSNAFRQGFNQLESSREQGFYLKRFLNECMN